VNVQRVSAAELLANSDPVQVRAVSVLFCD
jgi:hypothetical protein